MIDFAMKMKKDINQIEKDALPLQTQPSAEEQRMLKDIFRPDIEKFRLFTAMLRNNAILKKAVITHK